MRFPRRVALLALSIALFACSKGRHAELQAKAQENQALKPHLPESVSPDWKLTSLTQSAPPLEISKEGSPDCWRANYADMGTAQIWLCRYRNKTGAFDAVQNARTEPQIMKFQEGEYLVVIEWNDESIADLTDLVRAVKENLNTRPGQ